MILMKNREVFHHMARSLFLLTCACSFISSWMNLREIYMDIRFLVMSVKNVSDPNKNLKYGIIDNVIYILIVDCLSNSP